MLRQAQQPLTTEAVGGLDLSIFPWEDAATYVADAEAYLAETEAKPWLGAEDLDLMTPDMDAIVNDPTYDRWLTESRQARLPQARLPVAEPVEATRYWSGSPVLALEGCNWSFLDGEAEPVTGGLEDEPGYAESTQPWLF